MSSYYSNSSSATMLMTPAMSKPNNNGASTTSHAVSRSTELLSCARTALKISKSQYQPSDRRQPPPFWWHVDPSQLRLHDLNASQVSSPEIDALLQDGLSLLRTMDVSLVKLEGLVRRRGHTNDPTQEIGREVQNLEADAKELAGVVVALKTARTKSKQHGRHLQLVAAWLERMAQLQTDKLKKVRAVRGDVLRDQAQRRKLLNPHRNGTSSSSDTVAGNQRGKHAATSNSNGTPWDSPLFTMTASASRSAPPSATHNRINGGASAPNSRSNGGPRAAPPLYGSGVNSGGYYGGGGYGGGYGGGGYGGGTATSSSMGMRQRRTTAASSNDKDDISNIQAQIQMREQDRQSRARLENARKAESSLADLGHLFSKMSSLIHSQGETLENIEDDVEQALVDVTAGQEEIGKLYQLKKGNRALILKVFGIVIFFIIFFRLY